MEPYPVIRLLKDKKSGTNNGFVTGFERILQYVAGMRNICDFSPFPGKTKSLSFQEYLCPKMI